jgi:uncharacterized repeat protein (TIGR01451 family)
MKRKKPMNKYRSIPVIAALILVLSMVLLPVHLSAAGADINVPADYATIQAGIDHAVYGDRVHVAAGTYNEKITLADGVQLLGAGAGLTIIDGAGLNGPLVSATDVDATTLLDGFTIANCLTNGGMYNTNSSVTVANCYFYNNRTSTTGGGMFNSNSSPTVTHCTFTENTAENGGGGMHNSGSSSPVVTNCTFSGNRTAKNGGGMYNDNSTPVVSGCVFSGNNSRGYGAGMCNTGSSPMVANSIFSGNVATTDGGGMYSNQSSPVVTNCVFKENKGRRVAWMYVRGSGLTTITNCTCFRNGDVNTAGGIYIFETATAQITNCIFWENGSSEIMNNSIDSVIKYCDIDGGYPPGENILDQLPLFIDAANADFHLQPGSPCIDAGDNDAPDIPEKDFEGDSRVVDGDGNGLAIVDMGADEYVPVYDLSVTQTDSPDPVLAGNELTYHITAANAGPSNASGIAVRDTLPEGITWKSADTHANGAYNSATGVWSGFNLAAGTSAVLDLTLTVDAPAEDGIVLENTLSISPDEYDANKLNNSNTETTTVQAPILKMSKIAELAVDVNWPRGISPGDILKYTLVIENSGSGTATRCIISDTPDANTRLNAGSVEAEPGVVSKGNSPFDSAVEIDLGDLAPHQSARITYYVSINFPLNISQISNQAMLQGNNFRALSSDDPDTASPDDPTVLSIIPAVKERVGGELRPVNKLDFIIPWAALASTLILASFLWKYLAGKHKAG